MGPKVDMPHPICLVENHESNIAVNREAAKILNDIKEPVVVVAIVGKYRTGKSYLMNKLAGKSHGFALGATIQAQTKGIWMWCVPHPNKPNCVLVLLDTEGLGDVDKGNSNNDSLIFSLAVLLSSIFVYNSLGTIDQDSLEKLHYVTKLSDLIKLKSSPSNEEDEDESAEYKRTFPSFVWCIRDFSLKLEQDKRPITEDEYLQNSLKLKKGVGKTVSDFNLPRECIKHFFHTHKCFVFEQPVHGSQLHNLENLPQNQLEKQFVQQMQRFTSYVYQNSQPKTLAGGCVVTGRMLGTLTVTYVEAIRSGSVPCMENAVTALAEIENTAAIQDALSSYEVDMNELASKFPTETQEEFLNHHSACEKKAIKVFLNRSFKDDKREYQVQLTSFLQKKFEEFSRCNQEKSITKCRNLIKQLNANMEEKMKRGDFCKAGGHKIFAKEKETLINAYNNTPGKGIKANDVLQEFIESNKMMETSILKMDESLTENEKEMENNRIKQQAAEQKLQLERENIQRLEKIREQQEINFQQQTLMLKEKMEEDRLKLLKENEWLIAQKQKEKEDMMKEQFHQKAQMLEEQIKDLSKKNEQASSSSWIDTGIELFTDAALVLMPGIAGKAAVASKWLRRLF
ncbi:guanylate-binding protein 1 [Bombina bombina]|uniref:guanylate-binding protein 1 n=1 Tax=Bombina bombina TaxID=8345 RepID=UPI00235ADBDC|nr:guanylate-binding protein 1 [Bombina bombina]